MLPSPPMPSLYTKRGFWYLALIVNGKREQVATGYRDRAGAEAFARDYLDRAAESPGAVLTLRTYAERWLRDRETRGMRSVDNYRSNLRNHVYPTLGDRPLTEIGTRHVRELVHALPSRQGRFGNLAPRTVRHVYDALKSVLEAAHADELITTTPWVILRTDLPRQKDKREDWREGALYTREECEALITDERIPEDRRTLYCLLWLAGLRFGEASALRWSDYDREAGRLTVARSYSTARGEVGPTKTGTTRLVPVHPALGSVLAMWQASRRWGTSARSPAQGGGSFPSPASDLIVPAESGTHRRADRAWQLLKDDLRALGFPHRRLHDLRRTFVTMARSAGAQTDLVRWIVHGPTTRVIDLYTSTPWPALVSVVKLVKATLPRGTVVKLRRRG
jgi:integrase